MQLGITTVEQRKAHPTLQRPTTPNLQHFAVFPAFQKFVSRKERYLPNQEIQEEIILTLYCRQKKQEKKIICQKCMGVHT